MRRGRGKAAPAGAPPLALALALLLLCGLAASPPSAAAQGLAARVLHVNDGDTVTVALEGRRELVRILGIDAPETAHSAKLERAARRAGRAQGEEAALGRRARERLAELAPVGAAVLVARDPGAPERDQHGRLLAYLRLPDGPRSGAVLVAEGLARVFRRCGCAQLQELTRLEGQARGRGLGLWAAPRP